MADEDRQYSFAITLKFGGLRHTAMAEAALLTLPG
jgi:hypothetical protein